MTNPKVSSTDIKSIVGNTTSSDDSSSTVQTESAGDFLARTGGRPATRARRHAQLAREQLANASRKRAGKLNNAEGADDDADIQRSALLDGPNEAAMADDARLEEQIAFGFDMKMSHNILRQEINDVEENEKKQIEEKKLKDEANVPPKEAKPRKKPAFDASKEASKEKPATALDLAQLLKRGVKGDSFKNELEKMRSEIVAKNDGQGHRSDELDPRTWLFLSESASCNAVQSVFDIAAALFAKLSKVEGWLECCGKTEGQAISDITVALIGAAKMSASQAQKLVDQIVGCECAKAAHQEPVVIILVKNAVQDMPETLWPIEKMPLRSDLLDELSFLAREASSKIPPQRTASAFFQKASRTNKKEESDE